jgi:hypothetical protein
MKIFIRNYLPVFLIALGVRVFVWLLIIDHPERALDNDSALYISLAQNLLALHIFPSILRTPIYPLFIAATSDISVNVLPGVLISQCVLDSLTAAAVTLIFFRVFENNRYSQVAGLTYAFNPFAVYYANMILTETLFTFLFVLMFCFLVFFFRTQKSIYLASSSIMLGLSTLCRPIALYIPLLILPGLFFVVKHLKKKIIFCALFILCFFAVVVPWHLRNYNRDHRFILSTIDESNYFISFAPEVLMIENNPLSALQVRINEPIEHYRNLLWSEVKSRYGWREKSPFEVMNDAQRVALLREEGEKVILQRPLIFLASHTVNILRTLCPYYPPFSKLTGHDSRLLPILSFTIDLLTMVCFVLGTFLSLRGEWLLKSNRVLMCIMIAIIFYFSFIPGIVGYPRFRIPILPYICILSSMGFRKVLQLAHISGQD